MTTVLIVGGVLLTLGVVELVFRFQGLPLDAVDNQAMREFKTRIREGT